MRHEPELVETFTLLAVISPLGVVYCLAAAIQGPNALIPHATWIIGFFWVFQYARIRGALSAIRAMLFTLVTAVIWYGPLISEGIKMF